MPYLIVKPRDAWIRQARDAYAALNTFRANRGLSPKIPLRDLADLDRTQFGLLIEAFVALGQPVSQELRDLAGLKPVEEVL